MLTVIYMTASSELEVGAVEYDLLKKKYSAHYFDVTV